MIDSCFDGHGVDVPKRLRVTVEVRRLEEMKKARNRRLVKRVSVIMSAGVLFQTSQCSVEQQELVTGLISSITTQLVTNYVFDQFGVSQSQFGF